MTSVTVNGILWGILVDVCRTECGCGGAREGIEEVFHFTYRITGHPLKWGFLTRHGWRTPEYTFLDIWYCTSQKSWDSDRNSQKKSLLSLATFLCVLVVTCTDLFWKKHSRRQCSLDQEASGLQVLVTFCLYSNYSCCFLFCFFDVRGSSGWPSRSTILTWSRRSWQNCPRMDTTICEGLSISNSITNHASSRNQKQNLNVSYCLDLVCFAELHLGIKLNANESRRRLEDFLLVTFTLDVETHSPGNKRHQGTCAPDNFHNPPSPSRPLGHT